MKLRRTDPPPFADPDFVELISGLYYAFEDNLERCARIDGLRGDGVAASQYRPEALDGARRIAYVSRVIFVVMANLMADTAVPEYVLPPGIYGALARLAYALTALGEADPDPEALLTAAELDGLAAHYGLEEWLAAWRKRSPDTTERPA